jgi:membrane protease YdiL (CAAX protease family)
MTTAALRRPILVIALLAIAASWSYTLWTAFAAPPALPDRFSTLVLDVAIRKTIVAVAIVVLLRAGGESLRTLGFLSPRWLTAVGRGIVYGGIIFIVLNVGLSTMLAAFLAPEGSGVAGSLTRFFTDPSHLLVWIPIGVVAGGVVEEIERAFVLTRFEEWLGKPGLTAALVASSVIFGAAHLYQSTSSAISAGVSGLGFGLVYLRRRSGLEAAACHSFADVLGVVVATILARG